MLPDSAICTELMVKDPNKRLGNMGADEILAHPWFGRLDRDALVMDQVESPYVPNKDINAAPQRSIGSFADTSSKVIAALNGAMTSVVYGRDTVVCTTMT